VVRGNSLILFNAAVSGGAPEWTPHTPIALRGSLGVAAGAGPTVVPVPTALWRAGHEAGGDGPDKPPGDVPPVRWRQILRDAGRFLRSDLAGKVRGGWVGDV
jgi:hypothetical protein